MAQTSTPPIASSLMDINDWIKEKDEIELLNNSVSAPTIVKGRPTRGSLVAPKKTPTLLPPVEVDFGGKNWVGLLLEYRNAHPGLTGPEYTESIPGLERFTCTVSIGESLIPLGDDLALFTRKKDAKQYAAKSAIEWLVANAHMPSTDCVSFPKGPLAARSLGTSAGSTPAVSPDRGISYGKQVVGLSNKLGLGPPSYVITAHTKFPGLWSGFAHFNGDPRVEGRVGVFEHVFGRKKAKEVCAKAVLEFLQGIVDRRKEMAKRDVDIGYSGEQKAMTDEIVVMEEDLLDLEF